MSLNPQVQPILDALAAAPQLHVAPLAEGRASYDGMRGMGFAPVVEAASVESLTIPGPGGKIEARLYRPSASGSNGLLVHVHGGGFVAGSITGYDKESHAFAKLGQCTVLTFNYRLAPEHPFPAAFHDTVAVLEWAFEHAETLGCDRTRIAIGGDSAGANLSAATAIEARDRDWPLAFQMLIYPNVDYGQTYPSMTEYADMVTLGREGVLWAKRQYLDAKTDEKDWRASPLHAPSLAGLAPALIVTAGCDVLRDEAETYAQHLSDAGVETTLRRYDGLPHGFFSMGAFVAAARTAVEETCDVLKHALS